MLDTIMCLFYFLKKTPLGARLKYNLSLQSAMSIQSE